MGLPIGLRPGTPGASGGANYKRKLNEIMANLNKEIALIKEASVKGMINAAIYIRKETESSVPLTPVDFGNLRSSWFITTARKKEGNDQWNKGFRKTKPGTKKISNKDMASAHSEAIANAKSTLSGMETGNKKFLMMGYSANYAGFVHEFIAPSADKKKGGTGIVWKREGSGPKWFQQHVYANSKKIFQIIAETSKIKK